MNELLCQLLCFVSEYDTLDTVDYLEYCTPNTVLHLLLFLLPVN